MSFYPFETPSAFVADMGQTAATPDQSAQALMSEPGTDLMGGTIASTQLEIEYITSQLSLAFGTTVTIRGEEFKVLQTYLVDDGVFSRARLETT